MNFIIQDIYIFQFSKYYLNRVYFLDITYIIERYIVLNVKLFQSLQITSKGYEHDHSANKDQNSVATEMNIWSYQFEVRSHFRFIYF